MWCEDTDEWKSFYLVCSPRMNGSGQIEAEREWILEAEKLVDTFRETRMLFSTLGLCCLLWVL
jgi:hypothetical protein